MTNTTNTTNTQSIREDIAQKIFGTTFSQLDSTTQLLVNQEILKSSPEVIRGAIISKWGDTIQKVDDFNMQRDIKRTITSQLYSKA